MHMLQLFRVNNFYYLTSQVSPGQHVASTAIDQTPGDQLAFFFYCLISLLPASRLVRMARQGIHLRGLEIWTNGTPFSGKLGCA